MPSLISPEKPLTDSERENLEAELAPLAGSIAVNTSNRREKGPEQRAFDAQIAAEDPIAKAFERAAQQNVEYFVSMGIPRDKVERALRGSGIDVPSQPLDPAVTDMHRETFTAPPDAKPSNYSFDLGRLNLELPAGQVANIHAVMSQWSNDLRLDPLLAKGIGEYIAEMGPKLAKMSSDERSRWVGQQNSAIAKATSGNKAAGAELVEKMHKVLSMSGAISGMAGDERFSDAIKNGVIGKSAWLLKTFATHADALAAAEREKKKL